MTRVPDPPDRATYDRLYNERSECVGFGAETGMRVPCPFCCHPNFQEWKIWPDHPLHVETVLAKDAECPNCGRGIKALFTRSDSGVQFEMVQTCGDDPPSYLPAMRRVDS